MLRRFAVASGAFALAIALAGCGGTDQSKSTESGDTADASKVEVMTWWEQGSEKEGLTALEKVFKEKHPDTEFVNAAVAGGGGKNAKQKLQADLQAGSPPDTFQAHAGGELNDYIELNQIEDVSKYYDQFKLRDAFPKDLIDRLTVDGKIYSIPSNVHRANVVWANVEQMKKFGLDPKKPAADMDAWIKDLKMIKDKGGTPLTLGVDWTQTQLLETILIADLGVDAYNDLWTGKTDMGGADVKKALQHFDEIVKLADVDQGADWEPAMKKVAEGKAVFNVMGDWAPPTFKNANKEWDKDYVTFAVPGTEGVFDFLADSFTLPKGAKHVGGTEAWLDTISSKEGQIAFNKVKGSIPARNDLSDDELKEFSGYQQSAMKDFKDSKIALSLAHGAAAPVKVLTEINKAVVAFTQKQSDVDGFQKALVSATKDLKK